jgi:hypothetical protein
MTVDDSVALVQDERVERMEANGKVNALEFLRVHSDHSKLLHNSSTGDSSKRRRAPDDKSSKRHHNHSTGNSSKSARRGNYEC